MIIDIKPIRNINDIFELDFIDYRPPTGDLKMSYKLMQAIDSWFDAEKHGISVVATATTIILDDYTEAPIRNDFPDWGHPGGHDSIAHKYWNWFKWKQPNSKLFFNDSPDFWGEFDDGHCFWGDIGKVSSIAFAQTQKQMGMNDLWITVWDDSGKQTIIETHVDLRKAWNYQLDRKLESKMADLF